MTTITDPALRIFAARSETFWNEYLRTGDKYYLDCHAQAERLYDRRLEYLR